MFSLESPHRGDSKEYTQYTIFNLKNEKHPKLSHICSYVIFSKGLWSEFETAVVNEPSVFEPLKFYCKWKHHDLTNILCIYGANLLYMLIDTINRYCDQSVTYLAGGVKNGMRQLLLLLLCFCCTSKVNV